MLHNNKMNICCKLVTSVFIGYIILTSTVGIAEVGVDSSLSPPSLSSLKKTEQDQIGTSQGPQIIVSAQPSAEIQGSFSEEITSGSPKLTVDTSILLNSELKETVEEIVLTLAGSALKSEVEVNASDDRYVVRAEPRTPSQQIAEESPEVELENATDTSPPPHIPPEDIPSFSEWSQQQLAERQRAGANITERVRATKHRIKNYASPDCGAKIVAANAEAVSAGAVLSASRDEYMLNHCTSRIWFIVELCESVQAKQIDLANFELFSSSPKEFSVYLGSRFPSRDWRQVGKFTALDSRDIQTFDLNPFLFGKYLKVEVHSHYGKEHYCPLSWVRVYGTSEYEVLATEDDRHDDDDDVDEEEAGDVPRNLFSSATDAVLSIVKKATAPFLKTEERLDSLNEAPSPCVSPRYLVVCDNCSQHMDDNLFYLMSCRSEFLYKMMDVPFIRRVLISTDACVRYGLDFVGLREGAPYPKVQSNPEDTENYLTALFKDSYVAALCNALAVTENRVVVNTSVPNPAPLNDTKDTDYQAPAITVLPPSSTCVAPDYSTSTHQSATTDFTQNIQPTRTLKDSEMENRPKPIDESLIILNTESTSVPTRVSTTVSTGATDATQTVEDEKSTKAPVSVKSEEDERENDTTLDAILKDLKDLEQAVNAQPASATPPPSPPKDSIFLRLANRIKNLELNMSLSSSYLEELSKRYRVQLESLGQTVNSTSSRIAEQNRLDEIRSKRKDEEIAALKEQLHQLSREVALLMQERNSWLPRPIHIVWFIAEVVIVWYIAKRWGWIPPPAKKEEAENNKRTPNNYRKPTRRNSVGEAPGHVPPKPLERRPSDAALDTISKIFTADRKRKKKKKEGSRKSSTVAEKRPKSHSDEESRELMPLVRQASEPPIPTPALSSDFLLVPTEIPTANRFAAFGSPEPATSQIVVRRHEPLVRRFSSPVFMRTAMSARSTRSVPNELVARPKKESGLKKYMRRFF